MRGRLDDALAVMYLIHTSTVLPSGGSVGGWVTCAGQGRAVFAPSTCEVEGACRSTAMTWMHLLRLPAAAGMQSSTAEVEEELMQLWSSVEHDRAAAAARLQHAAQQRGSGWQGCAGGPPPPGSSSSSSNGGGLDGRSSVAAVESGAAGVYQRMQQAVASTEVDAGPSGGGGDEEEKDQEEGAALLLEQQQQVQQEQGEFGGPAAAATQGSPRRHQPAAEEEEALELRPEGKQHLERQPPPHQGQQFVVAKSFWRTQWDVLCDIYVVACGPERKALQVSLACCSWCSTDAG